MRDKRRFVGVLVGGLCFVVFSGCNSLVTRTQNVQNEAENRAQSEVGERLETVEKAEPVEPTEVTDGGELEEPAGPDNAEENGIAGVPKLAAAGERLLDFVPEGWELLDGVELDFNQDGITDYVGVLEKSDPCLEEWQSRILFAVASKGEGRYQLDFQDCNLIRTADEGGINGDPYMPLTAEGISFTTSAYGGSNWRWSERFTYTYKDGEWYLTCSDRTYGFVFGCTTDYSVNDWEKGIGIRNRRSDNFEEMEKEKPEYDLVYEIPLDEPFTIYQAGMRCNLAPRRVTDWTVETVEIADGIDLGEGSVCLPDSGSWFADCDENGVFYTFSKEESGSTYLARYCWQNKTVSVIAEEKSGIDHVEFYKGKVYYSTYVSEMIRYKEGYDGQEQIVEAEEKIGVRLYRMNPDGTGRELVYEYLLPEVVQEVWEYRPGYLALMPEISGDEIVVEVFTGEGSHPFYRMNLDGGNVRFLGEILGQM